MGERVFDLLEIGKAAEIANDLAVHRAIENVNFLRTEISEINRKIHEISEASKKTKQDEDSEVTGI